MTVTGSRAPVWRTIGLGGAVCLGLGVGAGLAFAPSPTVDVLSTPNEGAPIPVSGREYTDPLLTQVVPVVEPRWDATSRALGTVRDYRCQPGEIIDSGTPVLVVDDHPVLALRLARPPWRSLEVGTQGDDVADLQRELTALGFGVAVDGRYGPRTSRAVEALWRSVGYPGPLGSIPLDRVVWLPGSEATPAECPIQVGAQISPGDVIFTTGGGLAGLTIVIPEGALGGERVAMIGDFVAPVPEDHVMRDPAFLAAFTDAHPANAASDGGSMTLTIQTRLAVAIEVVAVPPSSLYDLSGSDACLLAPTSPLAVRVIASQLGEVMVTSEKLPTEVAPYPGDHAPPCR